MSVHSVKFSTYYPKSTDKGPALVQFVKDHEGAVAKIDGEPTAKAVAKIMGLTDTEVSQLRTAVKTYAMGASKLKGKTDSEKAAAVSKILTVGKKGQHKATPNPDLADEILGL